MCGEDVYSIGCSGWEDSADFIWVLANSILKSSAFSTPDVRNMAKQNTIQLRFTVTGDSITELPGLIFRSMNIIPDEYLEMVMEQTVVDRMPLRAFAYAPSDTTCFITLPNVLIVEVYRNQPLSASITRDIDTLIEDTHIDDYTYQCVGLVFHSATHATCAIRQQNDRFRYFNDHIILPDLYPNDVGRCADAYHMLYVKVAVYALTGMNRRQRDLP